MIAGETVSRTIDYILEHAEEGITLLVTLLFLRKERKELQSGKAAL